ncbi:MAG TPA: sigma-E factor negative regulatory protein [Ramlibacter sp.]|nr:sigma-E factor negative regulatory protein [Ramlibacter sp.]
MDGELEGRAADEAMDLLADDPEALRAWRTYHLISDAMRDTPLLSAGFAAAVATRIAGEPTVLAPKRRAAEPRSPLRWPAAVAAGLAGIGMVGYLAFNPQSPGVVAPTPMAQAPVSAPAAAAKPTLIPLPTATPDYLLAHQGFSPRVSLQGMAPYVRTVSDQANEGR